MEPSGRCAILEAMRSRTSLVIVTLVLFICLVCPLVEMFDNWDHTIQTGNDTEYALVILALCAGVAHSLARFILKLTPLGLISKSFLPSGANNILGLTRGFTSSFFDTASPPPLALRI
jgi:hypothetical protein